MTQRNKSKDDIHSAFRLVYQLGIVTALPLVAGLMGGLKLDQYWGTRGLGAVGGIFAGLGLGVLGAWMLIRWELPWNR